jgi:hypothetical protein
VGKGNNKNESKEVLSAFLTKGKKEIGTKPAKE